MLVGYNADMNRHFVLAVARGSLPCCILILVLVSTGLAEPPNAPAGRLPGHRNLFNGDCTFLFGDSFTSDPQARYDKQDLHRFIDLLADSGVDTYLQNPNAQVPWYPSKRTRSILAGYRRGDREFFRKHFRPGLPQERLDPALDQQVAFLNRYLDLAEDGVDWVAEIAAACRRRGISPWLSIRMNDMHGANSWEGSYMNCDLQRDPKYRLRGLEVNPRDGVNPMLQSLDYSHPEVRDYMLLLIRELVEDYDYEGLELDWLRCPFCFNPPATQENVDTMTQWTAEVRKLTQERARRTGQPYPLGLRLPCRLGLLKSVGLDVAAMVRAGTIDFVSFSNFWQTSWEEPLDELRRDLGDTVAIFGVIQDAPNSMPARDPVRKQESYRLLTASPELLRGNAAGKLALGADGIEQFNFFCTEESDHNPAGRDQRACYADLRGLDRLSYLRGKSKHYALASQLGVYAFPLWEHSEQVPCILEPEWKQAFRLPMCAEPEGSDLELAIQVVVEQGTVPPDLGVSFNGSWPQFGGQETDRLVFPTGIYTHHVAANVAYEYRFPATAIREGWNEVLVLNGSHKRATPAERRENAVNIVSVELGVRPAKKSPTE